MAAVNLRAVGARAEPRVAPSRVYFVAKSVFMILPGGWVELAVEREGKTC